MAGQVTRVHHCQVLFVDLLQDRCLDDLNYHWRMIYVGILICFFIVGQEPQ